MHRPVSALSNRYQCLFCCSHNAPRLYFPVTSNGSSSTDTAKSWSSQLIPDEHRF
nr:MAG TPA: hypothetical protein [Caudoviricetes sp.]